MQHVAVYVSVRVAERRKSVLLNRNPTLVADVSRQCANKGYGYGWHPTFPAEVLLNSVQGCDFNWAAWKQKQNKNKSNVRYESGLNSSRKLPLEVFQYTWHREKDLFVCKNKSNPCRWCWFDIPLSWPKVCWMTKISRQAYGFNIEQRGKKQSNIRYESGSNSSRKLPLEVFAWAVAVDAWEVWPFVVEEPAVFALRAVPISAKNASSSNGFAATA